MTNPHYYECHVTVEPVFDARLEQFQRIAATHGFKVAKLLMQKRAHEAPETSKKDSFCTGHTKTYTSAKYGMRLLVEELRREGFEVLRYKIEAVVFDTRNGDTL